MEELFDIIRRSLERCPWLERQSVENLLRELRSEVDEVERAVKSGDVQNLEEEIGDLVYDVFLVAAVAGRDYGVDLERAIKRVVDKISYRKPWLFWDERIELEEAIRIWNQRKEGKKG